MSAMPTELGAISAEALRRLHPAAIEDPSRVRALLERVRRERSVLRRGMNRRVDPETATLEAVGDAVLTLRTRDFESDRNPEVFLNFELDGLPYFFSAPRVGEQTSPRLSLRIPTAVYCADRRDRERRAPRTARGDARRALVTRADRTRLLALIEDHSPGGLGVRAPGSLASGSGGELQVQLLDGRRAGTRFRARVCHESPVSDRVGWQQIGLELTDAGAAEPLAIQRRARILETGRWQRARQGWQLLSYGARRARGRLGRRRSRRRDVRVVRYANERAEQLVGIVDSWGDTRGAPAVVIAPAWGRTKETLLPLARTIVATFRGANRPVTVVRFDGIRKRGESYNDPECRAPGSDHHHFTFSQGARDIEATLDFLERSPEFQPSTTILVTFSAASIEGRQAVALDGGRRIGRIGGWVCVVGSADLQSMMRVISGGVDYAAGFERGVRFGFQEILGVVVDIDRAGEDAIAQRMVFLEDAQRDMATIRVPITWFHGRHDAWMDLGRIRDILSRGDTSQRRLIEIPTGHQLKTSRQALETFQCIGVEAGRMALGEELAPALPDLPDLEVRHRAERSRRPRPTVDLRRFWRDYLLGRGGAPGIELMTYTSGYRSLMGTQLAALALRPGDRVADLGSGTGPFAAHLAESMARPAPLEVHQLDYVREALLRSTQRLALGDRSNGLAVRCLECDLDVRENRLSIPVQAESYDAVLASLLLSYIQRPALLLQEIRRVLRPGGRLVLSSLRRDADISRLYVEGLAEMKSGLALQHFGEKTDREIEALGRNFLNDAARLLDLEEAGAFRFWDADELAPLVEAAGFERVRTLAAFGEPPQAAVLCAERA